MLLCPITNRVKYIGCTNQKPENRLRQHLYDPLKCTKKWLNELELKGLKPDVIVLEENINPSNARYVESCYIRRFNELFGTLLNTQQ